MIACVDTYYTSEVSRTGVVLFENWSDEFATREFVDERRQKPADYVPGRFFQRELPCILTAISPFAGEFHTIIIDGYVWLDHSGRKGLGALLFETLNKSIVVIGVAKNRFSESNGTEVFRGTSHKPLIVTTAGIDELEAAHFIERMHGQHRVPSLIKRADYVSRHGLKTSG